ncbi:ATP-binding protein [Bifidobacterium choloepi]|uniref:ATP-binding protein n=1 Tax=Bifidobacterium choloepi TaxID=2614131 RepID=A0A6I5N9K4_9BIFI|nr:ATP-binding protein [Bifidobacterium choloepi]NEG70481.1 ATP-binding protein [Bifidobacterium choloepi]
MSNPFKPTAGKTPPVLIGRESDLEEFSIGLDDGPGAPSRLMYFTGARGVGKTVMLNAIGDIACERKWVVVDETADAGFIDRIIQALDRKKHRVSSIKLPTASVSTALGSAEATVGLGEVEFADTQASLDLRHAIGDRLDSLNEKKRGILVTLDEVQPQSIAEMRALATAVQHLIREDRNIAFVFAGLPAMVEEVINDDILTFLRRSLRKHLGSVAQTDIEQAFAETIHAGDKQADDNVITRLAEATNGYPYMIQLVGYYAWQNADRGDGPSVITMDEAERGIATAQTMLGSMVHGPAFDELPDMARSYLLAMSQDDGPSKTADIASRLGHDTGYANVYRTRLIKEDLIEPAGYGLVDFKIPYMREYLREHGTNEQMRRNLEE